MTETREEMISRLLDEFIEENKKGSRGITMAPQIDPMSFEAQIEMYRYADAIRRHAVEVIHDQKAQRQELNDQRLEE